jgi:heat shock protein HslJ
MSRALWVVLTGLVACGSATAPTNEVKTADLQGTWRLAEINAKPVVSSSQATLPSFTVKEQSIEGFDGCNSFSGRLDQPGSIASTRRGCPDDVLKLPLDLSDPMRQLKDGRIEKDRLIVPARDPQPACVFSRVR